MTKTWIKLYVDMLNDMKIGPLPVWLKWRFVELLLLAGESDKEGMLPSVEQMVWRLKIEEGDLVKSLRTLCGAGVLTLQGDRWTVTNFSKRQASLTNTERVQQFRKRTRNEDETKRSMNDNEDSSASVSVSGSVISGKEDSKGEGVVFRSYAERIGELTARVRDDLSAHVDEYTAPWVLAAIERAAARGVKTPAYISGILRGFQRDGGPTPAAARGARKPKNKIVASSDALTEYARKEGFI